MNAEPVRLQVVVAGDVNGDGISDLLFGNSRAAVSVSTMSPAVFTAASTPANTGIPAMVVATLNTISAAYTVLVDPRVVDPGDLSATADAMVAQLNALILNSVLSGRIFARKNVVSNKIEIVTIDSGPSVQLTVASVSNGSQLGFAPATTTASVTQNTTASFGSANPTVTRSQTIATVGKVVDVNITLSINHTWDGDIVATLISPDGTRVPVLNRVGGSQNNFTGTVLDDEAGTPIASGVAPYTGAFRPSSPLSAFDGLDANGVWTLELTDAVPAFDDGTLTSWTLTVVVDTTPSVVGSLTSQPTQSLAAPLLTRLIDGQSTLVQITTSNTQTSRPVALGDLDNDGYDEVGLIDANALHVHRGNENAQIMFPNPTWRVVGSDLNVTAGDFDNNAIGDLVVTGRAYRSIPLGNLFDDLDTATIPAALVTDARASTASSTDLGVDRIAGGSTTTTNSLNGTVNFNFANLGWDAILGSAAANDATAGTSFGGIRTTGVALDNISAVREFEEGIGMVGNQMLTFDVDEIRNAAGLSATEVLRFVSDRMGLNDSATTGGHVAVIFSNASGVLAGYVNGQAVTVTNTAGTWSFTGTLPAELSTTNRLVAFDTVLPLGTRFITLLTTNGASTVNSFTGVFSGARLEIGEAFIENDRSTHVFSDFGAVRINSTLEFPSAGSSLSPAGLDRRLAGLDFDGQDDVVSLPGSVYNNLGEITTSFWFSTTRTSPQTLVEGTNSSEGLFEDSRYRIAFDSDGKLSVSINGDSSARFAYPFVADGAMHHLSVVSSDSLNRVSVYLDGELLGTRTVPIGPVQVAADALILGRDRIDASGNLSSTQSFDGVLADFSVFNRALSIDEVRAVRQNGLLGSETGLHAWYRLAEGTGGVLLDTTGRNANGQLGGGTPLVPATFPARVSLLNESLSLFGAPARDLNGDRVDDLVIGAPFASDTGGVADTGALFVAYGSPSRISLPGIYDVLENRSVAGSGSFLVDPGTRSPMLFDNGGQPFNLSSIAMGTVADPVDSAKRSDIDIIGMSFQLVGADLIRFTVTTRGSILPAGDPRLADVTYSIFTDKDAPFDPINDSDFDWNIGVDANLNYTLNGSPVELDIDGNQFSFTSPLRAAKLSGVSQLGFYLQAQDATVQDQAGNWRDTTSATVVALPSPTLRLGLGARWFQFSTLGDGTAGDSIRIEGDDVQSLNGMRMDLVDSRGGFVVRHVGAVDLRTVKAGTYYLRVINAGGLADSFRLQITAPIAGFTHASTTHPDRDTLHAGDGNDLLVGNHDFDKLHGDSGADQFVGEPIEIHDRDSADLLDQPVPTSQTTFGNAPLSLDPIIGFVDTVVFSDDFETGAFNPTKWASTTNVVVDGTLNFPIGNFAARLNGHPSSNDALISQPMNLLGASKAVLRYEFQRKGNGESPEAGEDLILEYSTNGTNWFEIDRQLGNGSDMTAFAKRTIALPADALRSTFRFRFRSLGSANATSFFDDWFVDAISVTKTDGAPEMLAAVAASLNIPVTLSSSDPGTFSLKFDGSNDFVQVPFNAGLNGQSFSVEMWIRQDVGNTNQTLVVSRDDAQKRGFALQITSAGVLQFLTGNGNTNPGQGLFESLNGPKITTKAWTHVAATFSATGVADANGAFAGVKKLYVNGRLVASTSSQKYKTNIANDMRWGASDTGGQFFNGRMDEIRIWNIQLDDATIESQFKTALNITPSGLQALWHLDEGTGTTVVDSAVAGGSNNGTLQPTVGPPVWNTQTFSQTPLVRQDLTASQYGSIAYFNAQGRGLADLNSAEYLVNARWIDLSGNNLDDADLAKLVPTSATTGSPFVESLNLAGNQDVQNISQLAALRRLESLNLGDTSIDLNTTTTLGTLLALNQLSDLQINSLALTTGTNVAMSEGQAAALPYALTSVEFDGSSGTMVAGDALSLGLQGNFTASAWIKADKFGTLVTTENPIISSGSVTFNQGIHMTVRNQRAYVSILGIDVTGTTILNPGTWYNIAWRFNAGELSVFVNGILEATRTAVGAFNGTATVNIGAWPNGGRFFDGQIDNVRIWKRGLSTSEVVLNMNGTLPADATIAADWRFVEGAGSVVRDFSPNALDGELRNGSTWVNSTSEITTSVDFDGTNDLINFGPVPVLNNLTSNFSVGGWIKTDSLTGIRRVISGGNWGFGTSGNQLHFSTFGVKDYLTTSASLPLGVWTHIAAIMKADFSVDFYVNGVFIQNVTHTAAAGTTVGDFRLGGRVASEFWDGRLSGVGVWNTALNATQVNHIMNGSLGVITSAQLAFWRLNEGAGTTVASVGPTVINGTLVNGPVWINDTLPGWTVTGAVNASGPASPIALTITDNGLATATMRGESFPLVLRNVAPQITQSPTLGSSITEGQFLRVGATRLLASTVEFPMLLGNGTTFNEVDKFVATDVGAADLPSLNPVVSVIAEDGSISDLTARARRFADDALMVSGQVLDGLSNVTIAFWFKTTKSSQTVLSASSTTQNNRFEIQITSTIVTIVDEGTTYTFNKPASVSNLDNNTYHHLSLVRDLSRREYRLYIDGITSANVRVIPTATGRLQVKQDGLVIGQRTLSGGQAESNREFMGLLDEFAVWDRPLSQAEIAAQMGRINSADPSLRLWLPMNEAAGDSLQDRSPNGWVATLSPTYASSTLAARPLLYYPLNEITATVVDATGNGRTGTRVGSSATNQASVNPNLGGAINFNGGSINVPAVGSLPQLSIEAWVRPTSYGATGSAIYNTDLLTTGSVHVGFTSAGALRVTIGGTTDRDFGTSADFPLNTYTHVIVTYNSTSGLVSVFANGRLLGSQSGTPVVANLTAGRIASWATTSQFYIGRIDEFAIYDRQLTGLEAIGRYEARLLNTAVAAPSTDIPAGTAADFRALNEGNYTLRLQISDKDGGVSSVERPFTVVNAAPIITDLNPSISGASATEFGRYQFNAGDVTDTGIHDRLTYLWEVTTNNGQKIQSASSFDFEFSPESSGRYVVTLTVTDDAGASSTATQTVDVDPLARINLPTASPQAGSVVTLDASPSSPLASLGGLQGTNQSVERLFSWTVTFNSQTVATGSSSAIKFVPLSAGNYQVRLIIQDRFRTGGVVTLTLSNTALDSFTVSPADLVTIQAPSEPLAEGSEYLFSLLNLPPVHAFGQRTVVWNIAGGNSLLIPNINQEEARVLFRDNIPNGFYSISATITDIITSPDGSFAMSSFIRTTGSLQVQVNNLAPTITVDDRTGSENHPITVDARIVEPGLLDTNTFVIDWGDGTAPTTGNVLNGFLSSTHTYPQSGLYQATLTVTDNEGASRSQVFTIDVANAAPVGNDDSGTTNEDSVLAINSSTLLANDTDASPQDTLSVTSVSSVSTLGATVSLSTQGPPTIAYNPTTSTVLNALPQGQALVDTFTYEVEDANGARSTATVTITVQGRNDLPSVPAVTGQITEDSLSIAGLLLSGATDPDNGTLLQVDRVSNSPTSPTLGAFGSLSWTAGGNYTYTLNNASPVVQQLGVGQSILESFIFRVNDGQGQVDSTLAITITGTNDAPVAVAHTNGIQVGTTLNIASGRFDDSILSHIPVAYWRLGELTGSVAANRLAPTAPDGTMEPTIELGQAGLILNSPDTAIRLHGTEVVSIPSSPLIDAYVGEASARSIELWFNTEDATPRQVLFEQGGATNGLNLYIDAGQLYFGSWDNGTFGPIVRTAISSHTTYHVVGVFTTGSMKLFLNGQQVATGTTTFNGAGGISPDANQNAIGAARTTRFHDGAVGNGFGFRGTIDEVALYAAALTPAQVQTHYAAAGLLAGTTDRDRDDTRTIIAINGDTSKLGATIALPSGARLTVQADGSYEYDPAQAFDHLVEGGSGIDSFTYTITDSQGANSTATVTITVQGRNDAPAAVQLSATKITQSNLIGTLSAVDVDAVDTHTFTLLDGPSGNFAILGNQLVVSNRTGLDLNESFLVTVRATDALGASLDQAFAVQVSEVVPTVGVTNVLPRVSSVDILFNIALDTAVLNLYDGVDASVDAADFVLVGASTGVVRGSMVWNSSSNSLTFIRTGGPLLPDNYTLTLFSRADGFKSASGELLDGDANGLPGGDFTTVFTVGASSARIVSIADFARGATSTAGQTVNVALNNGLGGIPLTINNAADVLAVDVDVVFDHTLLDVSSAFVNVLPAGWNTVVNRIADGRVRLTMSGTTPLAAGSREIARVLASVPINVPYGAVNLLKLENLAVYTQAGGPTAVPSMADMGLHKAIFIGDANADGQYTAQDAGWIAGVRVGVTTGFDAYPWIDPVVVADVTQNGQLDGLDSSWLARKSLLASLQPEIPDLPAGSLNPAAGADPTIAADANVAGFRGAVVHVPIRIADSATGLWGVDTFIDYDTTKLDLVSGLNMGNVQLAGMFATESGWTMDSYADDSLGRVRMAIYRASSSTSTQGQFANVSFAVKPTAAYGVTELVVSGYTNVPPFTFTHVNGSIAIQSAPPTDIALSNSSIRENSASGSLIGTMSSLSASPASTFSYTLVSGSGSDDNSSFALEPTGNLRTATTVDFETRSSYSIRVRTTDQDGLFTEESFTISVVDLPELIGGATIGDGTSQRSLVKQMVATFDGAISIAPGAFSVVKLGVGGGTVATSATSTVNGLGQSVVTLSFSGSFTRGPAGALIDGYYRLVIDGTKITRAGEALDANRDGIGGDAYTIGATEADNFFALYGDTNGDGLVGVAEFGQFRSAFGKSSSQAGYNANFDFESDGTVGVSDFGQFRARFGKPKPQFP